MIKLLLDVDVGQKVYEFLSSEGHDVKSAIFIDASMPDSDILSIAKREERVVITMDKDFGELVYMNRLAHFGVVLLRLEEATGEEKIAVVKQILDGFSSQLIGKFSVYKNGRLRIRG